MQSISATEARASFSHMIDMAQTQPVVIRRQNRDVAVMISPGEYDKLRQINTNELMDICERASAYAAGQGLTEEKLAELLADES